MKLITWTTALSNSVKLLAMSCRATQDGWVMVENSDKMWSTGEGNGKPLQYSCLENPINSINSMNNSKGFLRTLYLNFSINIEVTRVSSTYRMLPWQW